MPEFLTLGELGSFSRGRGGTKSDEVRSGVACVRYGELYTHHDSVIRDFVSFIDSGSVHKYTPIQHGDVVFAASGETHEEIGKAAVFVADYEAYAGGDTVIFRPNSGVEPLFVGYAVNTEDAGRFKARFGQGSSVIHIAGSHLQQLPVFLPAPAEQRRIARVLDTVDGAIRATEALIAKLEQVKKGLLHDLLTCGIDDNGELRDLERHPEQFKDSQLSRIPASWTIHPLIDLAEVRSGVAKNSSRTLTKPVAVHYLRVANVQDGFLDLSEMSKIRINVGEVAKYAVLPGDVLMNEGGDLDKLGRGALWRGEYAPCVHQNHVFVVRCGHSLTPDFLDAWTGAAPARRYFMIAGKQTTNLASINKTAVSQLPVAVPPKREQEAITLVLRCLQARTEAETASLGKLRLVKSGLMDDLLTGRVRLPAAEETP